MIEIILKQRFGLFLVGVNKGASDFFFEDLQIFLVQGVLQELEILFSSIVGHVRFLDHVNKGFAHVDRIDAVAGVVVREGIVQSLHDKARGNTGHAFAFAAVSQLLYVDFLGAAFFDDFLAVVKFELCHQVALVGRLEPRKNRKHGGNFQRVRRDVRAEIGVADDLLVDLDFFREAQIVRHAHHHDAVENRFVGMIRFKLLPLCFIRVRHDHRVDVNQAVAARRRHYFFLSRGDHAVQVFDLVFKHLDKLDETPVADVERAVQFQHSGIALGVKIQFGNILAADQHGGILVVRIDGRYHADADARAFGEFGRANRELLVLAVVLVNQLVAADRTEIALDVNAEHFFKLFAQVARNQMQRLLEHRATFDGVKRLAFLEAAVKLFHQ